MAKQTHVRLTDDIDGSEAVESVAFAWRGTAYEIDLNGKHLASLEKALAKFIAHSRRVPAPRTKGSARSSGARAISDAAAVRDWARANGLEVSERGRIPESVRNAYNDAAQ